MNQAYPGRSHLRTSRWRIQVLAVLAVLALLLGVSGVAMAAPGPQPDAQAAVPQITLVGPAVHPRVGDTFQVQVNVQDVTGLAGYQVTLNYNNALVHAVSVSGIANFLNAPTTTFGPTITSGQVAFGALGFGAGKDGSGTLATITFQAVAAGTSPLTFAAPNATNLGGLAFTSTNGSVTVDPSGPPSSTNVRVVPAVKNVSAGDTFTVDVVADSVVNSGAFEFKLSFDPAKLAYKNLVGGSYLGAVTEFGPTTASGSVSYGQLSLAASGPSGGPKTLATITFQALAVGSSALDLSGVILTTADAVTQPSVAVDGQVNIAALAGAQFSVVPASQTVIVGGDVYVKIYIDGAVDLGAFEFKLAYNPAILSFLGTSDPSAGFLHSTGRSVFPTSSLAPGVVSYGEYSAGAAAGPSGSGDLVTLHFQAVGAGNSALTLSNQIATTTQSIIQPATAKSGQVTVSPLGTAKVYLQPAAGSHQIGDTFAVDVMVEGAADLGAFQFDLSFDKNLLQFVSLTGGTLIADTGRSMTPVGPTAGAGVVSYGQISSGAQPGANGGPYKLATITFQGIKAGTSPLTLGKVILTSTKGFEQAKTVTNGQATITALPRAKVYVKPAAGSHQIGNTFAVDVMVEGAADLGAFQFDLSFDKNLLQFVSLTGGTLIADTGRSMTPVGPTAGVGVVSYGQISSGAQAGANGGPYKLATITFQGIAVGTSPLDLGKVILTSTKGFEQDKAVTNGEATITALPKASVYVQPAAGSHEIGDTFAVDVMVNGAADLGAFQFDLSYDASLLQYVSLTGGTLIADTGRSMTPVGPNSSAGLISYGQISSGAQPGATGGPYKLATIRFRGIAVGTSPLDLGKVILTSTKGFEQDKSVTNGTATIVPLPTATVRLVSPKACARNGFDVEVWVDNASNLGAYQFKLAFNPALMEALGATDGGFLGSTGRTLIPTTPIIDNVAGAITVGAASSGQVGGPSGTGKLAVVHLRGTALTGASPLTLSGIILTDVDGFVQPSTAVNGSVTIKPFIIRLNPASTQIYIIDPQFRVDVVAECAYDLGSFQFDLDWDASIAKVDAVTDGGFISALRPISEVGPNIDNTAGYLEYGQISFGPNPGPNGNGILAHIDFTALKVDCASPLDLLNVKATDTRSQEEIPIVYGGALCVKDYALSSIGNQVWFDTNGNGSEDLGEPGIAGVKVTLTGTDEFAQPVSKSMITDANGVYLFPGLRAGLYQVKVDETTLPANHFRTSPTNPTWVTLARGANLVDIDFGYTKPALGGWVFIDTNGNGVRDAGETAGIAGVTIQLRNAATNALLQTVVSTSPSGWFDFPGIVPGSYKVIELTQPAGYVSTSPDTVMITIVGGQHKAANFGEWIPPAATSTPTATATPCAICQPTSTTAPTYTPYPTYTPVPTSTPTNTLVPPTATPTNTLEPTATPTNTPEPPTATPTATATAKVYRIYLPIIQQ